MAERRCWAGSISSPDDAARTLAKLTTKRADEVEFRPDATRHPRSATSCPGPAYAAARLPRSTAAGVLDVEMVNETGKVADIR